MLCQSDLRFLLAYCFGIHSCLQHRFIYFVLIDDAVVWHRTGSLESCAAPQQIDHDMNHAKSNAEILFRSINTSLHELLFDVTGASTFLAVTLLSLVSSHPDILQQLNSFSWASLFVDPFCRSLLVAVAVMTWAIRFQRVFFSSAAWFCWVSRNSLCMSHFLGSAHSFLFASWRWSQIVSSLFLFYSCCVYLWYLTGFFFIHAVYICDT